MVRSYMNGSADAFSLLNFDQCDLLKAFIRCNVDFLVVGGYAMRCHGSTRDTKDLDLVISQSDTNLTAIDFAINSQFPQPPSEILRRPETKIIYRSVEVFSSMRNLAYESMRDDAILVGWNSYSLPVINRYWLKKAKCLAINSPDRLDKREVDLFDLKFLSL